MDVAAKQVPDAPLDLAIIVVNFNTREHLGPCLDSVQVASAGIRCAVWLVDNCSVDGSVEFVRQHYPWVHTIVTARNGGYPYGNNQGLIAAGFDAAHRDQPPRFRYVMLLNPDTVMAPDALSLMLDFMDRNPDVGAVGPRVMRPDGTLDRACRRGEPTPIVSLFHMLGLSRLFRNSPRFARYNMTFVPEDQQVDVDAVMGACMLMRSEVIKQVGLLDERFFMYGEDLDLCIRIRRRNLRIVYYPAAHIIHYKGRATRKVSSRMIREFYRSMALFHQKHYASKTPVLLNWGIWSAVWVLARLKLLKNALTPAEKRTVGSAD
jgi:hypothetical protein